MATQTGFISAPAGVTVAKAFTVDTDVIASNGTATSVTAGANDPTHYTVVFTDLAAGSYRLVLFIGSDPVLSSEINVAAGSFTLAEVNSLDQIELWTKRSAVLLSGLLSGAGTNTEVYTISALGISATCTTDSSGNRTAVVWS